MYSIERGGERDSSLERSASFRGRVSKGRTVRMAAMFCRNMRGLFYLVSEGSNGLAARSIVHNNFSNVGRKDDFLNGLDLVELSDMSRVGFVRLMRNSSFVDEHAKKKTEVCVELLQFLSEDYSCRPCIDEVASNDFVYFSSSLWKIECIREKQISLYAIWGYCFKDFAHNSLIWREIYLVPCF